MKKYIGYALGEILLVVIGILIALSINNLNTKRQQQAELKDYLEQIAGNIKEDIVEAAEIKVRRDSVIMDSQKAINLLLKDEFDHDIVLKAAVSNFIEFYFTPNRSGFEALKSSGFIGKLKNKTVLETLYEYYELAETVELDEESGNLFIEEMEAQWIGRHHVAKMFFLTQAQVSGEKISPEILEKFRHESSMALKDPAVEGAILRGGFNTEMQTTYLELIRTGNVFIEQVKSMK